MSSLWLRSEVTFHCDLQGRSVLVTADGEGALPCAGVPVAHWVQMDFSRLRADPTIRPQPLHCHLWVHIAVQCSLVGQLELLGGSGTD